MFAIQETITEGLLVLPLLLVGLGVQFAGARVTLAGVGAVTLAMLAATQLPALLLPWWQTRTRELALHDASQP